MHVIGIVGGVASGKSHVAAELGRLGALVIDADRVGHEVLREPEVEQVARERWGARIFDSSGHIARARLAEIVFAPPPEGPPELVYLEKLTHPKIAERIRRRIEEAKRDGATPAIALDASVLLKAGWNKNCTEILFVDAPREVRLARVANRGWNKEDLERREAAQRPLDEQRPLASVVIENHGDAAATRAQIETFWRTLMNKPPA